MKWSPFLKNGRKKKTRDEQNLRACEIQELLCEFIGIVIVLRDQITYRTSSSRSRASTSSEREEVPTVVDCCSVGSSNFGLKKSCGGGSLIQWREDKGEKADEAPELQEVKGQWEKGRQKTLQKAEEDAEEGKMAGNFLDVSEIILRTKMTVEEEELHLIEVIKV
jgi:hypothetical protein